MKAIWITKPGKLDVLQVRESPDPHPGPGEVRIRVHAAGLNFADVLTRAGLYPEAPKFPCVSGFEAAGVVDEVGAGVKELAVGTRVLGMRRFGMHAEYVCLPAIQVVPIPDEMSFEHAAIMPGSYLCAHHMIFRLATVRPGESVLIHSAAGGLGIAAVQLCKTIEGVVTIGTSTGWKHDVLREDGCTHCIDYRRVDYAPEVRRLTGGKGVDVVLDSMGGKDSRKSFELLRLGGRYLPFGFNNVVTAEVPNKLQIMRQMLTIPLFTPLGLSNRAMIGFDTTYLWSEIDVLLEQLKKVFDFYVRGLIKPRIDSVHKFEDAAAGHRRIHDRTNIGKIVYVP